MKLTQDVIRKLSEQAMRIAQAAAGGAFVGTAFHREDLVVAMAAPVAAALAAAAASNPNGEIARVLLGEKE